MTTRPTPKPASQLRPDELTPREIARRWRYCAELLVAWIEEQKAKGASNA